MFSFPVCLPPPPLEQSPQHVLPVGVPDEIASGPVSLQTLKPVADRANPKMGVGMLAFSSDSYFLATRNGQCHTHRAGQLLTAPFDAKSRNGETKFRRVVVPGSLLRGHSS